MKKRIKLLHCTGRIPCINLDTGKEEDFISCADTEIIIDTETGAAEILADGIKDDKDWLKLDLLDDPLEKLVYTQRWARVDGAKPKKFTPLKDILECGDQ